MASASNQEMMLRNTIGGILQNNFSAVSALCITAYDIVVSFDLEVQHIWSMPWSLPNWLYLMVRYYGLLNLIAQVSVSLSSDVNEKFCRHWKWYLGFNNSVTFSSAINILLLLRINALYGGRKLVLWILVALFNIELVAEVVVSWKVIDSIHTLPKAEGLPLTGCLYTLPSSVTQLWSWIPCLTVACIFFLMTLWKFVLFLKDQNHMSRLMPLRTRQCAVMPILSIFVRDGTMVFIMVFSIILINTVLTTFVKGPLAGVAIPWLIAIYSVAGSRLVLNLRGAMGTNSGGVTLISSEIEMSPRRMPELVFRAGIEDTLEDNAL